MNLKRLFQMQKELGKVGLFNYKGTDRFEKLVLALLVEVGECANCWRGFKFWSVNQLPHTSAVRVPCMMEEDKEYYNPLLEEYVDGFHFVLELGIEKGYEVEFNWEFPHDNGDVNKWFLLIFDSVNEFWWWGGIKKYSELLKTYIYLGSALGFTWEEIEQAYLDKNKINLQRQETGY